MVALKILRILNRFTMQHKTNLKLMKIDASDQSNSIFISEKIKKLKMIGLCYFKHCRVPALGDLWEYRVREAQ